MVVKMRDKLLKNSKSLKSQSSKEKADLLMNAALELFLEKGFHPTRIEDIVARAKVGKGTFYLYYKNKEEVVEQCMNNFRTEIGETLNWVHANIESDGGVKEVFLNEARMLADTLFSNKVAGKFLLREGRAVAPEIDRKMSAYFLELVEISEQTLAMAMAVGLIKQLNPRVTAICIVGGIVQIFQHWLEGDVEEDVDYLVEETVNFYMSALGLE